jgi:hypothetical protein
VARSDEVCQLATFLHAYPPEPTRQPSLFSSRALWLRVDLETEVEMLVRAESPKAWSG